MTLDQVCDRLGWASTSKLSRIELGQSRPDLADVFDLLDVYDVPASQRESLIVIARDAATNRSWWKALGEMGERQRTYAELEAGAASIFEYQPAVVPGLLQTRAYARLRVGAGRLLHPEVDVEADTRARVARQDVLHRADAPRYTAILDEAVLTCPGVPTQLWRDQIHHLVAMIRRPNVTIRVLPRGAPVAGSVVHALTAFSCYAFPDPADPRTVVLEALTTDLRLTTEPDVRRYEQLAGWLLDAALSGADTVDLLTRYAVE